LIQFFGEEFISGKNLATGHIGEVLNPWEFLAVYFLWNVEIMFFLFGSNVMRMRHLFEAKSVRRMKAHLTLAKAWRESLRNLPCLTLEMFGHLVKYAFELYQFNFRNSMVLP